MKKNFFVKSIILAVFFSCLISGCIPVGVSTSSIPQPVGQNETAK